MKFRIKEIRKLDCTIYVVQAKILFFWWGKYLGTHFYSLEDAKRAIEEENYKDKIIIHEFD